MADTIDKLLTVEEVMANLRISRPTLYRLLKSEKLIPVRIGKRTLFDVQDIKAFVEASKGKPDTSKAEKPTKQKKLKETHRHHKKQKETSENTENIDTSPKKPHQLGVPKTEAPDPSDGQGRLL
jgi:excisionase family DNA binding protein